MLYVVLPIPMVLTLQINLRTKLSLIFALSLGLLYVLFPGPLTQPGEGVCLVQRLTNAKRMYRRHSPRLPRRTHI